MSKGESKDALQSLETQVDRLRSLKTQLDNAIADVDDLSQQLTTRSTEVRREIRDVFSKHILAMQVRAREKQQAR
jgi:ABC-type transporter Mla subunit MlaD